MHGSDDYSNLRAICSVCNEGAKNLTHDRPSAMKLLVQVRRAQTADQQKVMEWLITKFPKQATKLVNTIGHDLKKTP